MRPLRQPQPLMHFTHSALGLRSPPAEVPRDSRTTCNWLCRLNKQVGTSQRVGSNTTGMNKAVQLMMNMKKFDKLANNPVFQLLNEGQDLKGMASTIPPDTLVCRLPLTPPLPPYPLLLPLSGLLAPPLIRPRQTPSYVPT